MVNEITIITGDPLNESKGGASFTCFVLPFRYHPFCFSPEFSNILREDGKPYYEQIDMCSSQWVKRKRYFTGETAKVLYDHAKWFELPESFWQENDFTVKFDFCTGKHRNISIQLRPPRLALFEWHDLDKNPDPKNADLFHTGFLVVEARFPENEKPGYADLLFFNELFRYWRVPFEEHKQKMKEALGDSFGASVYEYYFQRWEKLLQIPLQLSDDKRLYHLFPEKWSSTAKSWWEHEVYDGQTSINHEILQSENSGWICYADDRAFVWSCAVAEQGVNALTNMGNPDNEALVANLGGWIKFLNVHLQDDIASINKATPFEKEWVKGRYYDRWLHKDILYGFNYHAGVMLAKACNDPPIVCHFHNQYLDMALLLFYLRVTLFRFSRELTLLSAEMRGKPTIFKKYRNKFKDLRREFAIFTNLYQFPLISNQQQAIEMYTLIRKCMDVEELFKEIEEEIKSSHEYFQFEEESKLNKRIFWLTVVGSVIAIIELIKLLQ